MDDALFGVCFSVYVFDLKPDWRLYFWIVDDCSSLVFIQESDMFFLL